MSKLEVSSPNSPSIEYADADMNRDEDLHQRRGEQDQREAAPHRRHRRRLPVASLRQVDPESAQNSTAKQQNLTIFG